jgi:nitrite reductase (NO-forming)/hydroxylamine reductase
MRHLFRVMLLVGAVLIATALGLALRTPAIAQDAAPTPATSPATSMTVTIANLAFTPHTIVVATGATITWKNDDNVAHTVHSHEGWFDSGEIAPGGTFVWQPNQPGTFRYNCGIHPTMEGVILVLPGGAVAPLPFNGQPVDQVFRDTCGGCHGPHREGGTGPALIPERLTSNDEFYFDTIKNGRPGTVMPAWGSLGLSDEEIWALVGYIRSEPPAEDVQWEMDQIQGSREILIPEDTLPDSPTHDGDLDNLMLVTEREARSIAVVDGDTFRLLGHIQASYRAHGYTFDPTSNRWAYNVGRDGWLFKIDLYTLQAVTKVRVGLDSRGLAMSDDGKYVIVGNFIPATAVILDAKTLEPLKVIHTDGTDPDGHMVHSRVCITSDVSPTLAGPYFIIGLKEAGQVWRIDWSKPDFPIDKVENVGHILHDGFLSPDNTRFYIASQKDNWMAVIDVKDWKLVDKISTGKTPHPGSGATWEVDGTVYGATVHAGEGKITIWDLANDKIVAEIPTAGPGLFLRTHENNPYVWADSVFAPQPNRIYIVDEKTFQLVHVIEEGVQTLHPEFTADGKYVYVADWQGNVVRVYDALTFEKVAEIEGITTPTGIFNTSRRLETLGH